MLCGAVLFGWLSFILVEKPTIALGRSLRSVRRQRKIALPSHVPDY